jgi:xylulokinase
VSAVIGIDSSTQACKVEVRRLDDGALLGTGRAPHPPVVPPRSEQDPAAWWTALVDATGEARRAAGDPAIAAIAVAGQQHGMVALDGAGAVVRPAKLWNDTESAPDAGWLLGQLEGGAPAWAAACGSVPVASFTITKLSWLHRSEPEAWARLAHVLLPHDWLTWRLTGERVTDRGDASGTGYWSPAAGEYRWDLLAVVDRDRDWSSVVPRVGAPFEAVGPLSPAAAAELDLDPSVLVGAGTGDNMAAALGLGLRPGDVAISIGTSGTVYAPTTEPVHDPTGAVAGFADAAGGYLPLVCTLNATQVTDAVGRWLGCDHDALATLALDRPAGAGGVTFLPYLAGERTPDRPDATGELIGLRLGTEPGDLARAAHEGVVCGLLDGLDALGRAGVTVDRGRLVLVGGGRRSPAYVRILADLAARPLAVARDAEHVATGACVQAAAVAGASPTAAVTDAWDLDGFAAVEPDRRVDAAAVRERYAAHRDR